MAKVKKRGPNEEYTRIKHTPFTEEFEAKLAESAKKARDYLYANHRIVSVEDASPSVKVIRVFGGLWNWYIDSEQKLVYSTTRIPKSNEIHKLTVSSSSHELTQCAIEKQRKLGPEIVSFLDGKLKMAGEQSSCFWSISASEFPINVDNKQVVEWKTVIRAFAIREIARHMWPWVESKWIDPDSDEGNYFPKPGRGNASHYKIHKNTYCTRRDVCARIVHEANKVINTCWGKSINFDHAKKAICKAVWSNLDNDVVKIAFASEGVRYNGFHYSACWKNKDELKKVHEHSPSVLPIWMCLIQGIRLSGWHAPLPIMPDIIKDVRSVIDLTDKYESLRKGGWKSLLKSSTSCSRFLAKKFYNSLTKASYTYFSDKDDFKGKLSLMMGYENDDFDLDKPVDNSNSFYELHPDQGGDTLTHSLRCSTLPRILNLFAEVGEIPRFTLLKMCCGRVQGVHKAPTLVSFMRAACRASKKSRNIKNFVTNEFELAWDWLTRSVADGYRNALDVRRHGTMPELDKNQRNCDWDWFMRQQAQWHNEVALQRSVQGEDYSWETHLDQYKHKGHTFVPLTSTSMLIEEGRDMHHCVGSYSNECRSGRSQIWSIRNNRGGKRVATVELKIRNKFTQNFTEESRSLQLADVKSVSVSQLRGPCNAEVSKEVTKLAADLAKRYANAVGIEADVNHGNLVNAF
jgi:hypothetical protein